MDFTVTQRLVKLGSIYVGPAFLVNPVSEYKARTRQVYCRNPPAWYDFWTGASASADQSVDSPAPLIDPRCEAVVIFQPAGMQYVAESRKFDHGYVSPALMANSHSMKMRD